MQLSEIHETIIRREAALKSMMTMTPCDIQSIAKRKHDGALFPGVYAIFHPTSGRCVYIGKTRSNTIDRRLNDHLTVDTPSDLKGMVAIRDPDGPAANTYNVRWIRIDDDRERAFFEHFAIGAVEPPWNNQ